jgi:hypothetical protein
MQMRMLSPSQGFGQFGQDGTHALLSKAASPGIVHIHDRLPVVLKPEHFEAWLDPNTPGPDVQEIIADSRNEFDSYPVSTRVQHSQRLPGTLGCLCGAKFVQLRDSRWLHPVPTSQHLVDDPI